MNNDFILFLANLALTLSFIVAVVFGIAQVRTAARDRKERLTLEALHNFQSREFAELISYLTRHKLPKTREEFAALPINEQVLLIQFGQMMESLGMMVAERYIQIDLVEKTLGSFVTNTWERCKPLYVDFRVKNDDPWLSEYFEWLAVRLEKRMRERPRTPFHER